MGSSMELGPKNHRDTFFRWKSGKIQRNLLWITGSRGRATKSAANCRRDCRRGGRRSSRSRRSRRREHALLLLSRGGFKLCALIRSSSERSGKSQFLADSTFSVVSQRLKQPEIREAVLRAWGGGASANNEPVGVN
jgi:hypothetical protein